MIAIAAVVNYAAATWPPVVAASIAAVVAVAGIVVTQAASRRDRRRQLYAEAYKTALALVEMVYRVRRVGPDNMRALADRFHQVHEDINFHQGWIEAESVFMGRAYRFFVLSVWRETRGEIEAGWEALRSRVFDGCDGWPQTDEGAHPNVTDAKARFLQDVSDHLSWAPDVDLRERYSDREWRKLRGPQPTTSGGTFFDPPAR